MCKTVTTYSNPRVNEFLDKVVDEKSLAQSLRRAAYLIALSYIRSDESTNCMSQGWTDDSFYFLNELAEVLDPVLEDK
jgi:hypothetical protein